MSSANMLSIRIRAEHFETPQFQSRRREMGLEPSRMHRKIWEFVSIANTYLEFFGPEKKPINCLGFGCGKEPIPAWLAAHGANVIATDGPEDNSGWTSTGQRSTNADELPWRGICSVEDRSQIEFRPLDMNHISEEFDNRFDFTWSSGSFEHIGGIEAGINFFCRQMKTLKRGGMAAHTTEFNPVNGLVTLNSPDLCLFREQDLRELERRLKAQRDYLFPLDLLPGNMVADSILDHYPYVGDVHLSISIGPWTATSVLLVAQRGAK